MNKIILIIILAVIGFAVIWGVRGLGRNHENTNATSTPLSTPQNSVSTGVIEWEYPDDFGLAISQDQVLVTSYIPPCESGFDYCMYYMGNTFAGTNFDSAGVRISKRNDISTERLCLTTPPSGYNTLIPSSATTTSYSASVFAPLGDAGAGHVAQGELYRLYVREPAACYEIETRIGESQYANYPAGTIDRFDEGDRTTLYQKFNRILESITIATSGESIVLPQSED